MKKVYLVMMSTRQSSYWVPVTIWENKKSAIEAIRRSVKVDKELKLNTKFKYKIQEMSYFLDLETPY